MKFPFNPIKQAELSKSSTDFHRSRLSFSYHADIFELLFITHCIRSAQSLLTCLFSNAIVRNFLRSVVSIVFWSIHNFAVCRCYAHPKQPFVIILKSRAKRVNNNNLKLEPFASTLFIPFIDWKQCILTPYVFGIIFLLLCVRNTRHNISRDRRVKATSKN